MARLLLPISLCCFILFLLPTSSSASPCTAAKVEEATFGCRAPVNSRVKDIFENKVDITWDPVSLANGYKIRLRREGAPSWEVVLNTGFTHGITFADLDPCTNYEYVIKTNCDAEESEFSEIFSFTTSGDCFITSTKELLSDATYQLQIFPNPTFGDVKIKLNTSFHTSGTIRILNSDGQVMLKRAIQNDKTILLSTDSLAPGIYWCQFYLENGRCTSGKRLIIQR